MQSTSFICSRCLRSSQQLRLALPLRFTTLATTRQSSVSRHQPPTRPSNRASRHHEPRSSLSYPRPRPYSTAQQQYTPLTTTTLAPPPSSPTPPTSSASPTTPTPPPYSTTTTSDTRAILNPRISGDTHQPLHISITPRAAHRLATLMRSDSNPHLALRITVESGGCHGFQYTMSIVSSASDIDLQDDTVFVYDADSTTSEDKAEGSTEEKQEAMRAAENKAKVVMDLASLELLEGSKVDYTMELIGSQFKIVDNPRATSSCGCGTSFDIKM